MEYGSTLTSQDHYRIHNKDHGKGKENDDYTRKLLFKTHNLKEQVKQWERESDVLWMKVEHVVENKSHWRKQVE